MGKIAFLFSGQGAQYTGMGGELIRKNAAAAEVFALADRFRPGTSEQCFTASKEELSRTVNTQPCVYAVDLAAAEALRSHGISPDVVAGFSLGEIAALTFVRVFSPEDGFQFVCRRGAYMDEAAQRRGGGMIAVLKLADETVEGLCAGHKDVYPVNYNCPGQLVVAGDSSELEKLTQEVAAAGGRAMPVAVSGAFHSPFMETAAEKLAADLGSVAVSVPAIPVYSDYTAELYPAAQGKIRENIIKQVSHPVRWRKILEEMSADGVDTFVEVGPGKTLSGLVKKTLPGARVCHVEDAAGLTEALGLLKGEDSAC